jgi:hypothetical protein
MRDVADFRSAMIRLRAQSAQHRQACLEAVASGLATPAITALAIRLLNRRSEGSWESAYPKFVE